MTEAIWYIISLQCPSVSFPTMLRSLYAYKGTHARTLGFQAGERFLEVGTSRDPNWMHVISERGALGYVPKNYVSNEEVSFQGGLLSMT